MVVDEDIHSMQNIKCHQSHILAMSARDEITPTVWTLKYAHHYVLPRRTATQSHIIIVKVLTIQLLYVYDCTLWLYFK